MCGIRKTIAVIGTGIMGQGIIKNLCSSGYNIRVYNRTRDKLKNLSNEQIKICRTPAEAAQYSDVIFSIVTDDRASENVWFGPEGIIKGSIPGVIGIELSTLSINYIDYWSLKLKDNGLQPLDCPMTGSKLGANTGTLSLFVSGEENTVNRVRKVLDSISKEVFYMGKNGNSCRFKLIYNMLSGTILVAFAEALGMAKGMDLDIDNVAHILSNNGWSSKVGSSKSENMLSHNHEDVHFTLCNMHKDLLYALASFNAHEFPVGRAAQAQIQKSVEEGLGNLDMSAISEIYLRSYL